MNNCGLTTPRHILALQFVSDAISSSFSPSRRFSNFIFAQFRNLFQVKRELCCGLWRGNGGWDDIGLGSTCPCLGAGACLCVMGLSPAAESSVPLQASISRSLYSDKILFISDAATPVVVTYAVCREHHLFYLRAYLAA